MADILQRLASKYLSKHGYHVRPPLPRPKIGDKVTFIVGGNWDTTGSYTTWGIVTEFPAEDKVFKSYPYTRAERRNENGALEAYHLVHPYQILRVESKDG